MAIDLHRTEGQMLPAQGTLTFTLAQELEELDSLTLALEIDSWSEDFAPFFGFDTQVLVSTEHIEVSGTIGTAVEKSIGNLAAWVGTIDLKAEGIDYPSELYEQFKLPEWIDDAILLLNSINLGNVLQGKSTSPTYLELLEGSIAFHGGTAIIDGMNYNMTAAQGSVSSHVSIDEESLLQSDISLGLTAEAQVGDALPWFAALLGGTAAFGGTWLLEKIFSKQVQERATWTFCIQGSASGLSAFSVKRDQLEADPACLELEPSDSEESEEGDGEASANSEVSEDEK